MKFTRNEQIFTRSKFFRAIKPLFTQKKPPIEVAHVLLYPNATRASRDTRQSLLGALLSSSVR